MQFFKITKIFFFNIFFLIFLIIIVELIFGKWFYNRIDCRYVLCNVDYKIKHNVFGKIYISDYKKDEFGLRGNYNNITEIDSLFIGGSTTDQRIIGLEDTWILLSQKLVNQHSLKKYVFANAGIDGQSTTGHIWNFNNWFNKILELKPKFLFFYIGLNDFVPNLHSPRYDNIRSNLIDRIYSQLYNNSITFELFKIGIRYFKAKKYKYVNSDVASPNLKYQYTQIKKSEFWDNYKEYYLNESFEKNLVHIINLTNKMNAVPIFITQRSARWQLINNNFYGANCCGESEIKFEFLNEIHKLNYADVGIAEMLISKKIVEVCNAYLLTCYDGFSNYDINPENTYDLFHTNIKGNRDIASKFSNFFLENIALYDSN